LLNKDTVGEVKLCQANISAPLNDPSTSSIKKHSQVFQGITNKSVRRLARRAGVKLLPGFNYEEIRDQLEFLLKNVIRDAIKYTEHAKRKTVTAMDVVYALKRQGKSLYGFGSNNSQQETEKKSYNKFLKI